MRNFLAGSITSLFVFWVYTYITKPKKSIKEEKDDDPILIDEQLTRVSQFFADSSFESIRNAFVIVVGLGGVGSHCATHLIRSGVGKVRLIDFDQVTLSSLNRHAVATRADVGSSKVMVMKRWARKVLPSTIVEAVNKLFSADVADELLSGDPDFVVDAIDNIQTKVDLLRICVERNIKVVSSSGSACKSDPSLIQVADISLTKEDKLAKSVRSHLRKYGIKRGIPVCYSLEKPQVSAIMPSVENPTELAPLPNFRVRILPVLGIPSFYGLGPLPAMFGCALASHVLCQLAEFPQMESSKTKSPIFQIYSEAILFESHYQHTFEVLLTEKEALQFYNEQNGKSVVSGSTESLVLRRLDVRLATSRENLILLTKEESKVHLSLKDGEFKTFYQLNKSF